jgi:hypothetical protein
MADEQNPRYWIGSYVLLKTEDRLVYQFYPWHIIFSIRQQEEEETREQELL